MFSSLGFMILADLLIFPTYSGKHLYHFDLNLRLIAGLNALALRTENRLHQVFIIILFISTSNEI